MNILVTGAKGFVGKNLIAELRNRNLYHIFEYDIDTDVSLLDYYTKECDFVFHLAGINRPKNNEEFMEGNFGFTSILLDNLKKNNNKSPIVVSSSTQANLDNPYGKSKKAGENLIFDYERDNGVKTFVYQFPNIFGKWCKPNYNSAVATFCYNIARDLPIKINDPNVIMKLVYIDDVVEELISALEGNANRSCKYCEVKIVYTLSIQKIVDMIISFKHSRENLYIPNMRNSFEKKLYSTYLSYLPIDKLKTELKMNEDSRGSFTEFIRTVDRGQFSVNIAKPGIIKGNHWHHTKNEKFLVVSGNGLIRLRKIDSEEITEHYVSGEKMEVVDIPVGYTHNIVNVGDTNLITFMWANEVFNKEKPDTFFQEV